MDEYIERRKLEKWILNECASLDTVADREYVIERLREDIPAADVRPVVRGEWLPGKEIAREYLANESVAIDYENITCSACKTMFQPYVMNFNYCPNCGADMRGEK